ncbi:hypothetical protein CUR178_00431 [Leishmania enriettii]|uniref:Polymerase nucleotidyl transferase domain-containing protein n=1 Tax=Leishmania enriettii TaxID=5663 RepID=A0A836G3T6_LEIEN|nr:hypothetical protein CUR178_00431 [Leishmania enriettii]
MWGSCKTGSEPGTAAQVLLYGSYAVGLSLPSSDINFALTFRAEEEDDAARCSA